MKKLSIILIFVCFASLFLLCYAPALVQGRQFGFRDAGHYYYPLHQRVQREWNEGRWPLWEPEENAGVPLLGNPTAAVFYPGKLVFAALPYPWAARIYIVMHTALAFIAMLVLLRSWEITWSGSGLGALSYAFGAPILFQYCNVIFLVGAAWLPLGMHAVDRWVRLGCLWGLWELAAVLAMQVLGGDPQAAYLLGLAGVAYALGLAWSKAHTRARAAAEIAQANRVQTQYVGSAVSAFSLIVAVLIWAAATVALGIVLPKFREPHRHPPIQPLPWMLWMPMAVAVTWGLAGLGFLYYCHWRRRGWRQPLGVALGGLVAAAALAASLSAAQLLPVVEFTQLTMRAAEGGTHDIYPFSVEPYRLVELVWPNIAGFQYRGNSYWPELIRIPGVHPKVWVPTLYLGGMTVILAIAALGVRQGPPWRVWLSAIAVVSLLGGLGEYTSPIWAARAVVGMSHSTELERLAADLGPADAFDDNTIRKDGFLRDGDGSIYWWLATFLPGFRQFRFPAKLFTLTSLALAALAGVGWDRICAGRGRPALLATLWLTILTVCVLAGVVFERHPILAAFRSYQSASVFGPLDAAKGFEAIVHSLLHSSIVLGLGLGLFLLARSRPGFAGLGAVIVMTLDLAAANSRYVFTVEQSLLEGEPGFVKIINKAEADRDPPVPGPFRVHRMPAWNPPGWNLERSPDRVSDFVAWERDTIQPKYGINFGIEYTHTSGVAELYDYEWYFAGFFRTVADKPLADSLGIKVGEKVVYFPRRGYDMWNTRYFVVPMFANGWRDEGRASAAFRFQIEPVYPDPKRFLGPGGKKEERKWTETQDFRIMRNDLEYPRSWVVHNARAIKPVSGLSRESRSETMQEILYPNDLFWYDYTLTLFDPHEVAWVSRIDLAEIMRKLSGRLPRKSESVTVSYPTPQRARLEVTLDSPGLVILSDVYYPGWQLTIDDVPAPVYRVNGFMRGALVSGGHHRLDYSFAPRSFQIGLVGSIAGLAAWLVLGIVCKFRPVHPQLSGAP